MSEYTQWYVYTGEDELLNEIVSKHLVNADISNDVLCSDGVNRNMWACDHAVIRELNKLNTFGWRVKPKYFVKQGLHGQVRPWNLENGTSKSNKLIRSRLQDFLRGHKKQCASIPTTHTD